MARSLHSSFRFRIIFFIFWLCWSVMHVMVLKWFGFSWNMALKDSLVFNILLSATCLLIGLSLHFYLPLKNRYVYILALVGILSLIWLLAGKFILGIITDEQEMYQQFFSHSMPIRFSMGFLLAGCMALMSVLWYTLQDQQEIENRKAEAEKLSKEAELFKLRHQLQPHFLFNSLNSINALIQLQPQKARTMVQQLSDFLRGTIRKDEHQWIGLEEELQYLELYLEIEKVRFGHRLTAEIINQVPVHTARLPALLMQPVLENAIKFGLYDTTGDVNIKIEAFTEDGYLVLRITNPFDPDTARPRQGTGFGLSSVQRRLYLLFARQDLLLTEMRAHLFITTIKIPVSHD